MFRAFGNGTECPPAAWHPEPNFRGTANILLSCLSTIILCVWTVIHLNLPEHKKEHLQAWRKCGWVIVGLLAPELVAWNAWIQRRQMKKLTNEMDELRKQRVAESGNGTDIAETSASRGWQRMISLHFFRRGWHWAKVHFLLEAGELKEPQYQKRENLSEEKATISEWTELHSWYALMGGYAFDTSSAARPFLPAGRERVTLTVYGLVFLAETRPHLIPKLSKEDILDKSKFDGLAKFITCWQAGWFCIQCIYRLSQHLSISLLELNVFAHAICALLIFMIWWGKPKDISQPTKLEGPESDATVALLSSLSPMGLVCDRVWGDRGWLPGYNFLWIPREEPLTSRWLPQGLSVAIYSTEELVDQSSVRIGDRCWALESPYKLERLSASFNSSESAKDKRDEINAEPTILYPGHQVTIDQYTVERLQLIQESDINLLHTGVNESEYPSHRILPPLVKFRISDWGVRSKALENPSQWAGIMLATALYGGLHTTAWNTPFPTTTQQLLWRISSATVALAVSAAMAVFWALVYGENVATLLMNGIERYLPDKRLRAFASGASTALVLMAGASVVLFFSAARVYLLVGCFINLAYLPRDALVEPSWSQYIPHVT